MQLRTFLPALVVLTALALAGCGDAGSAAEQDAPAPDAGDGDVVAVDVSMQDIEFGPDSVEVPAGATVVLNLTNDGALEHDLVFEGGPDSGVVAPGDSTTLEAGPFTEDTIGWCDVPGHREAGMELEIIVTD